MASVLILLAALQSRAAPLVLERILPIDGPANLQPSGLAACQGRLLLVSDRHNNQLFELVLEPDGAGLETFARIDSIPAPDLSAYGSALPWLSRWAGRYDWEGVSCDEAGRPHLLSETLVQVLRLEPEGKPRWLATGAYPAGRGKGLFEHRNAFAEGLALSGGRAYIAAERHPRGLVALATGEERWRVTEVAWLAPFPDFQQPYDFAGLWLESGYLYTLERNHYQVCRRELDRYRVQRCWSYRQAEETPEHRYRNRRFGRAEGLARLQDRLYLVLDNNGDPLERNAKDRRPRLYQFRVPPDWSTE